MLALFFCFTALTMLKIMLAKLTQAKLLIIRQGSSQAVTNQAMTQINLQRDTFHCILPFQLPIILLLCLKTCYNFNTFLTKFVTYWH